MRKLGTLLAAGALGLIGAFALVSPASATETKTEPIPVVSFCNEGWFVNHDEEKNLPVQQEDGIFLDGPKMFKRSTNVPLKFAPENGGFQATVSQGVAPLFKMETSNPYSTVNKTAAGKYWSSKIISGPGSQGEPVDHLKDLIGKWNYTIATKIVTFGVGYANDEGNKALVKSVRFGKQWFNLECKPVTATPPVFTNKTCEAGAFIFIPRDKNVSYKLNDVLVNQKPEGVKIPVEDLNKDYVVTVKAGWNKYLKENTTAAWTFKVTQPICPTPTVEPTVPPTTAPPVADGPTLPKTGFPVGLASGIGGIVVAVGVALYFIARRRRVVTALPE